MISIGYIEKIENFASNEMSPITDRKLIESKILLRPDEAAAILRVSRRTIYHLCDDGILDTVKIRGSLRIKTESIQRLLLKAE